MLAPLEPHDALFLDYDGTLTPIVEHPANAWISDYQQRLLEIASGFLGGALAVISGRALHDLTLRTGAGIWRIGGHGTEIAAPGPGAAAERRSCFSASLVEAANRLARQHDGLFVEVKPTGVALHYRNRPELAGACLAAMSEAVLLQPGFTVQRGKMVVEARPRDIHKGEALRRLMQRRPFRGRHPLMLGDDLTDESAFEAALALDGRAIKIGPGPSQALERMNSPAALYDWLSSSLQDAPRPMKS